MHMWIIAKRLLVLSAAVGWFAISGLAQTASPPAIVPSTSPASGAKPSTATTKAVAKDSVAIPPEKAKPITIPRFEKPPVIDGKLDDAGWQTAAVLRDFYQIQPGDNIPRRSPQKCCSATIPGSST